RRDRRRRDRGGEAGTRPGGYGRHRVRRVDLRIARRTRADSGAAEIDVVTDDEPSSPLELLEALGVEEVEIAPGLAHLEIYTMRGLLSVLWHGPRDARDVVVMCGGGM